MRAALAAGAILALAPELAACTVGSKGSATSSHTGAPSTGGGSDCGYSWNPCPSTPATQGKPQPSAARSTISDTTQQGSVVWGTAHFGQCAVYIWPERTGLVVKDHYYHPSTGYPPPFAAVVMDVSEACVGYPPSEWTIHIHLQRYYSVALPGQPAPTPDWHDVTVPVRDTKLPPVVPIDPNTGYPYKILQHHFPLATPCLDHVSATYRISIDVLGGWSTGDPIIGGGTSQTFTTTPALCGYSR
jgi:hypothetical protein